MIKYIARIVSLLIGFPLEVILKVVGFRGKITQYKIYWFNKLIYIKDDETILIDKKYNAYENNELMQSRKRQEKKEYLLKVRNGEK